MPLSKQEVLAHKQSYYEANRDVIKAKNLARYHAKQVALHGEGLRRRGRPRLTFPEVAESPDTPQNG
jgi:hypothetical protein